MYNQKNLCACFLWFDQYFSDASNTVFQVCVFQSLLLYSIFPLAVLINKEEVHREPCHYLDLEATFWPSGVVPPTECLSTVVWLWRRSSVLVLIWITLWQVSALLNLLNIFFLAADLSYGKLKLWWCSTPKHRIMYTQFFCKHIFISLAPLTFYFFLLRLCECHLLASA